MSRQSSRAILNVCALSLALVLSAEPAGTAELKSSLEIVNRTGNQDYFILAWKLTEGEPKSVTYTVQVSDENGNRSWKNIRGLAGTERQAALFIGETGHTYRFRSLARGDSGAEEVKSHDQSDATAKFGTPPQDISFGVNPYPLCPNWGGAYIPYVPLSLIRGEYIHMAFGYFTNGKEKFSRGDVVIEVPEGVRIVGATYMPYFNRETNEIPIYHCGAIKRGKKRYNVHFVPNTPKVEGRYYGYRHILRVYFAPESGYDGGDKFHWFPIQDGVAGKRVSADIEVLPELPASKTPKHFDYHIRHQTEMPGCQDLYMTKGEDRDLIRKRYELKKKTGFVALLSGNQATTRRAYWLIDQDFEVNIRAGAGLWWLIPGYFKKQTKEKIAAAYGTSEDAMFWLNKDGKDPYGVYEEKGEKHRIWCYYCPTYLARRNTVFYENWSKPAKTWWEYNGEPCKALNLPVQDVIDFEIAMRDSIYDHCFCPRCIESFARRTKLPKSLTPAKILADHKDQWATFRVWQNGEVLRTWCHANKTASENRIRNLLMVCTQPSPPVGHDNLDLQQVDAFIDGYQDEITCAGLLLHDHLEELRKYITKPCTIYPNPCSGLTVVTANDARLGMLASASSGAGGFMTDQWFELTGRHIWNIIRARNEIATLEDFFYDGKRVDSLFDIEALPLESYWIELDDKNVLCQKRDASIYMRAKAHQLNGRYLIDLFNYDKRSDLFLKISGKDLPTGTYALYDPIGETQFLSGAERLLWAADEIGKGFVLKVPTEDVRFVVLEKTDAPMKLRQRLPLSVYEEEHRRRAGIPLGTKPVLRKGDISIGWDDVEGKRRYELMVKTPSQTVWISPAFGSQIWRWQAGKEKREIADVSTYHAKGKYGRTLGMDRFSHWGWGQAVIEPYELVSRTIEADRAVIVLKRDFAALDDPANGVVLTKTYAVFSKSPIIQVNVEVTNGKDVAYTCDFYAPQWPYLGRAELDNLPLGQQKWTPMEPAKDDPDQSVGGVLCPATGEILAAKVNPEQLRGWYIGRAHEHPPVFEWVYKPVELKLGETWSTEYRFVYLPKSSPENMGVDVGKQLEEVGVP